MTEPRRSWSGAGAQNLQNKRRGRVFHLGSTLGVELDLAQRQTIGWKHRDDIEFQHLKLLQRRRDIFRCCLEQSDPPADRSHVVMARTPLPAPQAPGPLICTMVDQLKTPAQTCRLDSPLLTCWEGAAPGLAPPHAAAAATLMQCQARSAHAYARGGSHSSDLARLRMLDSHEQARRPAASESVRSVRLSQHGPGFSGQLRPSLRVSHASRPLCICNCRVPARQHCA